MSEGLAQFHESVVNDPEFLYQQLVKEVSLQSDAEEPVDALKAFYGDALGYPCKCHQGLKKKAIDNLSDLLQLYRHVGLHHPQKLPKFFSALEDTLRPKYGKRLFGTNESDLSYMDQLLMKWLRKNEDLSAGEKLLSFWFSENKNHDNLPVAVLGELTAHLAVVKDEHQNTLAKFLHRLNSNYFDGLINKPSRSQPLFERIVGQLVYINEAYVYALANALDVGLIGEDRTKYNKVNAALGEPPGEPYIENLILKLHEVFADIAANYYDNFILEEELYLNQLAQYYLSHLHDEDGSCRLLQADEQNMKASLLDYCYKFISGDEDSEEDQAAIKLAKHRLKFSIDGFQIEKLTHDLKVVRQRIHAKKAEADKALTQLQLDINRLAEEHHVGIAIKEKSVEDSKKYFYHPPFIIEQKTLGLTSEDERVLRALESRASRFAHISAIMVAIGEGSVAAVAIAAVLTFGLPIVIFIGAMTFICGALANYLLIRSDAFNTVLSFFKKVEAKDKNGNLVKVRAIYLDRKGNIVPTFTRIAINIFAVCALSAGFAYGSLAAMSMFNGVLLPFFLKVGLAKMIATGLAIGLSAFPVGFLAIGMAAIFYAVIDDFIKNRRWEGMKDYFKDTYFPSDFKELSTKERWAHCLLHVPFHLIKLGLCLAICAVITVASFGVFHMNGVNLLIALHTPGGPANTIAYIASALNGVLSLVFGISKIQDTLSHVSLRGLMTGILHIPMLPLIALSVVLHVTALVLRCIVAPLIFVLRKCGLTQQRVNWYQEAIPLIDSAIAWWHNNVATHYAKAWIRGNTFCALKTPVNIQKPNPVQKAQAQYLNVFRGFLAFALGLNGGAQGALLGTDAIRVTSGFVNSSAPNGLAAEGELKSLKIPRLQRRDKPGLFSEWLNSSRSVTPTSSTGLLAAVI